MLAVNPRTTWTWPQQSPSPTNNHSSKRKKKDTENVKTSFSDYRASKGKTTTAIGENHIVGVVGRQILPSAGNIFHDQKPCEYIEDAEPASKVSRIATESEANMKFNCMKSGNSTTQSFNDNNNVPKGTKQSNTSDKRKLWLKRKKKLRLQNSVENKTDQYQNQTTISYRATSSNGNNYSVTNNVDSIDNAESTTKYLFWNDSGTKHSNSNIFNKISCDETNTANTSHRIHPAQNDLQNFTKSDSYGNNDESAKNRLLDILLSDKEHAVNHDNESKHESAIKQEQSASKKSFGGGRLPFVKKFSHFSNSRPTISSGENIFSSNKDESHFKLSEVNNSIKNPTNNDSIKNENHTNGILPRVGHDTRSNHENKIHETARKEEASTTLFKRGTFALSSIRKSLKRKFVPSNSSQNEVAKNFNTKEVNDNIINVKNINNTNSYQSMDHDIEPMEVDISILSDNLVSGLTIVDEDKPSPKIPHHLAGVGSCDTSQDSGLGEELDHNSSYTSGNTCNSTTPRTPNSLNLQQETSGRNSRLGDQNGSLTSTYPTPILRPPTLSFRDSTCSSNFSSLCSTSTKKHVVIQEPNMNKIHQFSYNSFTSNRDRFNDEYHFKEDEERSLRFEQPEKPIKREIVTYRDVTSCVPKPDRQLPVKYSVTNQWKRIYKDAEEEALKRLEQKFCHVRNSGNINKNFICDNALKSGTCGKGFHRYVGLIFVDSSPPSSVISSRKSFIQDEYKDLTTLSSAEISQLVDVLYQMLFFDGWLYSPRDTIIVHCIQRFLIVVVDVCCQELDIDVRLKLAKDFRYLLKQSEQEHYQDLKKIVKQTQVLYIQLWCSLLCVPFQPKKNCYNNTGQISGQLFA